MLLNLNLKKLSESMFHDEIWLCILLKDTEVLEVLVCKGVACSAHS